MAIISRPATSEDEPFLFEVYASTRLEELAVFGWAPAQQEAFLKMQFNAQQRFFEAHDGVAHEIILLDGRQAGRIVVIRTDQEIRLADIALLPAYRNAGSGSFLIKALFAEARLKNKPVRLQVSKFNEAATRLYERLGFSKTGESSTHFQMEWDQSA
jgi:ribosomal protein S18 acetylase RimI-like enzyme